MAAERTPVLMAFGPGLWDRLGEGFDFPPSSLEGMVPATQGDLLVWIQADNRSALFDAGLQVHRILAGELDRQLEVQAFVYHDLRDLSGFVHGIGKPGGRTRQGSRNRRTAPGGGRQLGADQSLKGTIL